MEHCITYPELWRALLPRYDDREAKAVVRTLLEEQFGLTLTDIVCGGIDRLDTQQREVLQQMMARLGRGEPIQYVLGHAPFCGRHFKVGPDVLIPRPETQQLAAMAVEAARQTAHPAVLDIGTGSGCLAISIALDAPQSSVTAWDISPRALQTARDNAEQLHATVDFRLQDALHLPMEDTPRWDIIVSNPPYVMEKERAEMADNVLGQEPELALFVPDDDPLRFYRAIARYGRHALRHGGTLLFEINPLLANAMQRLLKEEGYNDIALTTDESDKERFTTATI